MKLSLELVVIIMGATASGVWAICAMLIAIWRAIGRIEKNYVTHEICEKRRERCSCENEKKLQK